MHAQIHDKSRRKPRVIRSNRLPFCTIKPNCHRLEEDKGIVKEVVLPDKVLAMTAESWVLKEPLYKLVVLDFRYVLFLQGPLPFPGLDGLLTVLILLVFLFLVVFFLVILLLVVLGHPALVKVSRDCLH